jgi:transcriptional regulator with XRE-family HTH domain
MAAGRKEVDEAVGARVRLRRVMLKMTLQQVAAALGIAPEQLQEYEAGERRFDPQLLADCGTVLRVPVTWFFEDALVKRDRNANECLVLVEYYQAIQDPALRSSLLEFARRMAEDGRFHAPDGD